MRVLRTYRRKARIEHFCDRCLEYILPGQTYEGWIHVEREYLFVLKYHVDPCCDFPDEPDYKENDESQDATFSMAA